MKCKCGEELIFLDSSLTHDILFENYNIYPKYYCRKCDRYWDGVELDCKNKYVEYNYKEDAICTDCN